MALTILYYLGFLAFSQAQVARPFFNPRIVNREIVELGEIPYQVSIQNLDSLHICNGVILNDNYVLTTTSCVKDQTNKSLQVIAGINNLGALNQSKHTVDIIKPKNDYDETKWTNDIALLKVNPPFETSKNIKHVKLPESNIAINDNVAANVSGWSTLWLEGLRNRFLFLQRVTVVNRDVCNKIYEEIGHVIEPSQICAYDSNDGKDPCDYYLGGPLTLNGTLIGLVSGIHECGNINYPTVYTRVDSYLDWINVDIQDDPSSTTSSSSISSSSTSSSSISSSSTSSSSTSSSSTSSSSTSSSSSSPSSTSPSSTSSSSTSPSSTSPSTLPSSTSPSSTSSSSTSPSSTSPSTLPSSTSPSSTPPSSTPPSSTPPSSTSPSSTLPSSTLPSSALPSSAPPSSTSPSSTSSSSTSPSSSSSSSTSPSSTSPSSTSPSSTSPSSSSPSSTPPSSTPPSSTPPSSTSPPSTSSLLLSLLLLLLLARLNKCTSLS